MRLNIMQADFHDFALCIKSNPLITEVLDYKRSWGLSTVFSGLKTRRKKNPTESCLSRVSYYWVTITREWLVGLVISFEHE